MATIGVLVCGFLLAWTSAAKADRILVAENGRANAVVVIADGATAPQRHAAGELAGFLGQVTGATFAVIDHLDRTKANLLVGPQAARLVDPGFSTEGLGSEGIVLRTVGGNLILAGGEPRGTVYSVYTFLEEQVGCRFWTPAVSTIPRRPTLGVDSLNVRFIPVLEYRETDAFGARDGDWSARNKCNGYFHQLRGEHGGKYTFEPGFCHTFYTLIPPGKHFDEHPEWFSMIRGKRTSAAPHYPQASLCLTNEAMRRQLVSNLKQSLRDAPAEAACSGLSEVRFYLPGGKTFVGEAEPGRGWSTAGDIRVSVSSEHPSRWPLRAIDGAGLDLKSGLLHGTDPETMFMTGPRRASAAAPRHPGAVPGEHWIAFEFDQGYPLGEMWIWNQNETIFHTQGMRRVTVRYSATGGPDPLEWSTVFSGEIPAASGMPGQAHQAAIDFRGALAKCVVITCHSNWAGAGRTLIAEVSQPDDDGPPEHCECPDCAAIEKAEGGAAGVLVRFLNAVAADLKPEFSDVPVSTLAYHYTQKPPAMTKPRPDVIIRLCSIKCSFRVPMTDDGNAAFRDDVVGWSRICQRLYIWDYVVNFSYPLAPHPNLRVLGPNIRFLAEHGAKGYFGEAMPQSPGFEMAELRSWVLARLMWNPDLDGQGLVEEFVRGYYGPAGDHVLAYLNLMHDAVEESGDYLGLSSPPDAKFLSLESLCRGWRHLQGAEKAVSGDPALVLRVRIAQLPVMYVFLRRFDELRKQAEAANVQWPMPATAQALHERIQAVAREGGMNLRDVPSPIPF